MTVGFDGLLSHLGTGRWTAVIFAVACYRGFLGPGQILTGAFMAPQVNHTCRPPEGALANYSDKCTYQIINNETGSVETHKCEVWDFDNSTWTSTLNSEFNLACDSSYLGSSFTSTYMLGWGFGAAFNGMLCDLYGRKTMFCLGITIYLLCIVVPWLPSMTIILVCRFIIGFGGALMFDASSILALEIVEPRVRPAMSMTVWIPWVLGIMTLGGLGSVFRDWRTLHIVLSLPYALMIATYWILDESPRWLMVKGRRRKALKILRKAARWQNVILPSDAELAVIMDECRHKGNKEDEYLYRSKLVKFKEFIQRFFLLFRTPRLRTLTLVAYFNFIVLALLYFGLALSGVQYSDDPFIFMVLSGVMELPACTIIVPIVSKFGRKIPGILFFFICGTFLLILPFLSKDLQWLSMTLALLAKGLVSMAWAAFYLQCTELFPTEVRLLGMGTAGAMNSVGSSISAPINDLLSPVYPWAPSVIFGLASIMGSIAMALLPESNGLPMPETIHELETRDYNTIKRVTHTKISAAAMTRSYTSMPSLNHA